MKKVIAITLILLVSGSFLFAQGAQEAADETQVVKFWYHFDNPETALNPLIEKFEAENPGIKIEAERISSGVRVVAALRCRDGSPPSP